MSISFVAMNRMLEERAAEDESYRRLIQRNGKCTLSDGRALPDEALLAKLRSVGLKEANRDWLDRISRKVPSAQMLATVLSEHGEPELDVPPDQEDWIWISLVCLWERWFPDRPNFEMLDDQMQAGYDALKQDEPIEAAQLWLQAWRSIEYLMQAFEIRSFEEFDGAFGGTQSVFNWIQDFPRALYEAGRMDQRLARERLAVCRGVLDLLESANGDQLTIENFRRDMAESHADLGDCETVDSLYTQWLNADPRWGWGWIGWSDVYYTFAPQRRIDAARAEQILGQGLAVPDVHDRNHLVERLASLYEETGRAAEAADLRADTPGSSPESRAQTEIEGGSTSEANEWSLDDIVAELNAEYTGKLPEQAIRAAQRRREEVTPRLIDLISQATETVRAGNELQGNGHLFALFLLTEFEALEALPAILEAVSLPGEGPFELYGDAITEDLNNVLAVLASETPEVVGELIGNRSLNKYVRWVAAQTYLHWVRDGRWTREQAVQRLREHLDDAIINGDADAASGLVSELVSYAPREALDEIREAFRRKLVDCSVVDMGSVQRSIAEGESRFQRQLEYCSPTGIPDTVAELSSWASYDEDSGDEWETDMEDEQQWRPVTTIRNTGPKVSRNAPCPCGSGRKHKKCCGAG